MQKGYEIDGKIYSTSVINEAISDFSDVALIKHNNNLLEIS
jgi:hypothetical protein